jgi:hypothetical protein
MKTVRMLLVAAVLWSVSMAVVNGRTLEGEITGSFFEINKLLLIENRESTPPSSRKRPPAFRSSLIRKMEVARNDD